MGVADVIGHGEGGGVCLTGGLAAEGSNSLALGFNITNSLAFGLSVDLASIVLALAPTDNRAGPVGILAGDILGPDTGFFGSMLIARRMQYN